MEIKIKSVSMKSYCIDLVECLNDYEVRETWGPQEISVYKFRQLHDAMNAFETQYDKFLNTYEN